MTSASETGDSSCETDDPAKSRVRRRQENDHNNDLRLMVSFFVRFWLWLKARSDFRERIVLNVVQPIFGDL